MVPFSVFTYYIMEHDFNISSHHPSYFHFLLFRKSTDTPLYVPDSLACDGQMLVFVEATKTENSSSVRRRKKGRKKEKKKKSRSAQQLQFHLVWFLSGRFSHCHSSICTSFSFSATTESRNKTKDEKKQENLRREATRFVLLGTLHWIEIYTFLYEQTK